MVDVQIAQGAKKIATDGERRFAYLCEDPQQSVLNQVLGARRILAQAHCKCVEIVQVSQRLRFKFHLAIMPLRKLDVKFGQEFVGCPLGRRHLEDLETRFL